MVVVTAERVVRAPPEQVFDFVGTRHFENHPRWDPDVIEMRQTSPGPVAPGTTARIVRRQGRGRVEGTATVTAFEPPRRAAWDVRFGAFALPQAVELLRERDGTATRLRLIIDTRAQGPLRLLLPLMRGRFRSTMKRSLATIDSMVGKGQPASRTTRPVLNR